MLKISKALLLVLFVALFVRFVFLDRIPVGLSNDELDYVLNAKALFLTGSDISGTWNPLTLTAPASSFPQAEIPPLLTFLPIGILPLSLFYSKIIYVFFNTGIVVLLYLIAVKLFSKREAFFIGFVAAINPWLLFLGRTAYDAPLAIFWFLLAMYIMLYTKGWQMLLAIIPFFVAFYSYIGAKVLFVPILFITSFYSWFDVNKKKFTKEHVIFFLFGIAIIVFYVLSIGHVSRLNEIAGPNITLIKSTTDIQRREAVASPITPLFINKYVLFGKYVIEKYLNAFSPNFLFLHGDGKPLFSVFYHGVFYYTDILFLLIGLYGMFIKHRKTWIFFVALALIAPLPSVASTVGISYAIRSMLLCPALLIFIGYGISYLFSHVYRFKNVLASIVFIVYILQFFNFGFIYFLQNPVSNSESFNLSGRILAKYLSLSRSQGMRVISGDPKTPLKQYLFYTNSYNKQTAGNVKEMYKNQKYQFENISFVTCSDGDAISKNETFIYESGTKCKTIPIAKKYLTIAQLSDGGSIFSIVNDSICSKYALHRYPQQITFADLNVEKLSEEQFCKTFITNYFQ